MYVDGNSLGIGLGMAQIGSEVTRRVLPCLFLSHYLNINAIIAF